MLRRAIRFLFTALLARLLPRSFHLLLANRKNAVTLTWATATAVFQAASIHQIQITREGMEKKC
jgi:hypothetical protein